MNERKRSRLASIPVIALATATMLATTGASATSVFADVSGATSVAPGAVVSVPGESFLWVADDQGMVHLVGDTRALANHAVNWSDQTQLTLDQIQNAQRGDPWLSTPFVKIGDAIYLPKWETNANAPTLYHVQSAGDLGLFGITGQNYGALVQDQAAWQAQTGFSTDSLQKAELPAAMPTTSTTGSTATGATTSTGTKSTTTIGTLGHPPVLGTDVTADTLGGRGWTDASNVAGLSDQMPMGALNPEAVLGRWRYLASPGSAYVYIQMSATDLSMHPDVTNLTSLATLKQNLLCRDADGCQVNSTQDATFGGVPAKILDMSVNRNFPNGGATLSGISSDNSGDPVGSLTWTSRDVLIIAGNWAYDIRMASIDPNLFNGRMGDLNQMLTTLQFHY